MSQQPKIDQSSQPHARGIPGLASHTLSTGKDENPLLRTLPQRDLSFRVLGSSEIYEIPKEIHFATFDFDGTLCVTEELLHVMRYRQAANRALGWEVSDAEWNSELAGALGTGDTHSSEGIHAGCLKLQTALLFRKLGCHTTQGIIGRTLTNDEFSRHEKSAPTKGDLLTTTQIEEGYWALAHRIKPKDVLQYSIAAGLTIIASGVFEPRPGVVSLLKGIRESGRPCNLNTGTCRQLAEALLKNLELERYFEHVITGAGRTLVRGVFANEIPKEDVKPAAGSYNRAAHKLSAHPTEAIAFEDTISGSKAAARSGYKVIVVTPTPEVLHGDFDGFVLSLREAVRPLIKPGTEMLVARSLEQIVAAEPPVARRRGFLP